MNRDPLWSRDEQPPAFSSLADDLSVDVAIVGAGITGLTTAYRLRDAGLAVVVLEGDRVASGVTGSTSAHLTAAVDARYHELARSFGDDSARAVFTSSTEAIAVIERIALNEAIDCDFRRVAGFLCDEKGDDKTIDHELAALERLGIRATLVPSPLPWAARAIRFDEQARFRPIAYVAGLARAVTKAGVRIFESTRVRKLHDDENRLETDGGTVKARSVVIATHTPLTLLSLQVELAHDQSYCVAFTTSADVPDALFWDTADPYHYIRKQRVAGEDLLIVGGFDHRTGRELDTRTKLDALCDWVKSHFEVGELRHRWSSQVVSAADGLPYIGPIAGGHSVQYATGYAGNGLTFGTLAGVIMADRILGTANPYGELYSAKRIKPLASVKDIIVNNAEQPLHYLQRGLEHVTAKGIDSIAPGDGAVVRDGTRLLAVHRGEDGALTALDPVCPHLGCLVRFNRAEKTWDCPCHGSRFGCDGNVIAGPSTRPLERTKLTR